MDNFTKETTEGLAYLDSLDGMEQIDALVLGVSNVLSRYEAPTTSEAVTAAVAKSVGASNANKLYAAVCTVIVEAAKADCTADTLTALLEEASVAPENAKRFTAAFEPQKEKLRWMLKSTGLGSRCIVGCEWRLDYLVRSSTTGVEHVPSYFVSLKIKAADGVGLEVEEFTCSQEQMLDLLASVRNATKQVDRILASE